MLVVMFALATRQTIKEAGFVFTSAFRLYTSQVEGSPEGELPSGFLRGSQQRLHKYEVRQTRNKNQQSVDERCSNLKSSVKLCMCVLGEGESFIALLFTRLTLPQLLTAQFEKYWPHCYLTCGGKVNFILLLSIQPILKQGSDPNTAMEQKNGQVNVYGKCNSDGIPMQGL